MARFEKNDYYFDEYFISRMTDVVGDAITDMYIRHTGENPYDFYWDCIATDLITINLLHEIDGCNPHYCDDGEPCYKHFDQCHANRCAMQKGVGVIYFKPKNRDSLSEIIALIQTIKCDRKYQPTDDEIKKAYKIIWCISDEEADDWYKFEVDTDAR